MRGLLTLGRQAEAAQIYEDMSQLLLSNFGIMPSEESRTLYREAMRTGNHLVIPADTVQEQLREASGPRALWCATTISLRQFTTLKPGLWPAAVPPSILLY